ncbi:hypothetical protein BAL199_08828 [alpha proteobacterium BAL199]|nr:hypothetical protein BAL199_08828 [alpha proteobacterium BAL199]
MKLNAAAAAAIIRTPASGAEIDQDLDGIGLSVTARS